MVETTFLVHQNNTPQWTVMKGLRWVTPESKKQKMFLKQVYIDTVVTLSDYKLWVTSKILQLKCSCLSKKTLNTRSWVQRCFTYCTLKKPLASLGIVKFLYPPTKLRSLTMFLSQSPIILWWLLINKYCIHTGLSIKES